MESKAREKVATATVHWHRTLGENVLRLAGITISMLMVSVGLIYGFDEKRTTPPMATGHIIKHDQQQGSRREVLVLWQHAEQTDSTAAGMSAAEIIIEAIDSYHGAKVSYLPAGQSGTGLDASTQMILVLGDFHSDDAEPAWEPYRDVLLNARERGVPIFWLGEGISRLGWLSDAVLDGDTQNVTTPPGSRLIYKGARVDASGLRYSRNFVADLPDDVEVVARLSLHGAFDFPAIIRRGKTVYSAIHPFSSTNASLALAIMMDVMAGFIGDHPSDPRVVFRLEDVNAREYGQEDSSFSAATEYLLEEDVFMHLGIIPLMVDAEGVVEAKISDATPVLDLVNRHRDRVALVQHGYRHHRIDDRNEGLGSGEAYEFFNDDDLSLGVAEARRFAGEVTRKGYADMVRAGIRPTMFEAPHYALSPSQQEVINRWFSLMQHPPAFHHSQVPAGLFLPWLTQRNGTVYVSSSAGYVDIQDDQSVDRILRNLEEASAILPDPVVTVFYHPFVMEVPGREDDLRRLIRGIRDAGYRFVNLHDLVAPMSVPKAVADGGS